MTRRWLLSASGLILLSFCAALAVLPARWALAVLPGSWPVAVVDAAGTLWSGSATVAIGKAAHRRTVAEPLRWRLSVTRGFQLLVSHPWLGGELILTPGWRGVGVSAQTLQLPAAVLSTLDARIAAIGPGGEITLTWPATFVGSDSRPTGATLLDMRWRNAVSDLTPIQPLGDYALALKQAAPGKAELILSTRQGPLMLNGSGLLDRNGGFRFDGAAQADPDASAYVQTTLRDLLVVLGPQRNNQTLLRFH